MKVEIHLLQNFAPSCLNRDDTNTPKECDFGGVRRARISSQCFKHAIRKYFEKSGSVEVGTRTKLITSMLVPALLKVAKDETPVGETTKLDEETASIAVRTSLSALMLDFDKDNPTKTEYLIYVCEYEVKNMARAIYTHCDHIVSLAEKVQNELSKSGKDRKKKAKSHFSNEFISTIENIFKNRHGNDAVDLALFGRMLADAPTCNIVAACQVGHALSTHAAALEMDFYSAVDDENPKEETGAGMLGYTGFQSACFYRYALIDVDQLAANLGGDATLAKKAVEALLWAFCDAEPSARQNSMPAHNRPSLGLFVARDKGVPTSLANAFCKPVGVKAGNPDLVGASVGALVKYHETLGTVYEAFDGATQAVFSDGSGGLGHLADANKTSQRKAIEAILEAL